MIRHVSMPKGLPFVSALRHVSLHDSQSRTLQLLLPVVTPLNSCKIFGQLHQRSMAESSAETNGGIESYLPVKELFWKRDHIDSYSDEIRGKIDQKRPPSACEDVRQPLAYIGTSQQFSGLLNKTKTKPGMIRYLLTKCLFAVHNWLIGKGVKASTVRRLPTVILK